jgi:hypothetical protein
VRRALTDAQVEQESDTDRNEAGPLQQAKRARQLAERKLIVECNHQDERDPEQPKHIQHGTKRSLLAHLRRAHPGAVRKKGSANRPRDPKTMRP